MHLLSSFNSCKKRWIERSSTHRGVAVQARIHPCGKLRSGIRNNVRALRWTSSTTYSLSRSTRRAEGTIMSSRIRSLTRCTRPLSSSTSRTTIKRRITWISRRWLLRNGIAQTLASKLLLFTPLRTRMVSRATSASTRPQTTLWSTLKTTRNPKSISSHQERVERNSTVNALQGMDPSKVKVSLCSKHSLNLRQASHKRIQLTALSSHHHFKSSSQAQEWLTSTNATIRRARQACKVLSNHQKSIRTSLSQRFHSRPTILHSNQLLRRQISSKDKPSQWSIFWKRKRNQPTHRPCSRFHSIKARQRGHHPSKN